MKTKIERKIAFYHQNQSTMKKSIFLIAPLTFLMSCTTTSEIFDDAYDEAKKPAKVEVNDESGYADYIKNQEDMYDVQIDSNKYNNRGLGANPSYYGDNHNHLNHQQHQFDYYGTAPMNNSAWGYSNYMGMNGFGMNFCQYQCMTWRSRGNCWHVAPYNNGIYGQSWNQYGSMVWGYPNDPYQNCYGNAYYPNGYNYYYGNNGFNGYYGNVGGWYNNNYYWSGYYPNGYYNSYNGYWGSPYYGGYNYGWGAPGWGNGWNNNNNWNNNWSNNNQDWQSNGNHHYGHRNGTNTGSNSQNNTNYEHTVKGHAAHSTPFPVYAGAQELGQTNQSVKPKPGTATAFGGSNATDKVNTAPPSRTIGTATNNTQQFTARNDNNGGQFNTNTSNSVSTPVGQRGTPATNQFTAENMVTTTNVGARNGGSNNTYTATNATSSRNGSSSANNNSGNTYANPNKYGTRYNPSTSTTNSGSNYNSGTYNNTSRRDYNSNSNRSNTPRNYNSNSNRSTNNSYNGSRSSTSGSSSSRSNSSGNSGSNSTSRRR